MAIHSAENYPKVTSLMVMSSNGVVAQREVQNSFEWNSPEDRQQFLQKIHEIGTVLMGANTYRSIGSKPYEGIEFHVLTHHPDQFSPHERVKFWQDSVIDVLREIKASGVDQVALLGGPKTNAQCFDQQLVSDIYLTIEPLFMPEGMHVTTDLDRLVNLKLENLEVLNERNTLLLHYQVIN